VTGYALIRIQHRIVGCVGLLLIALGYLSLAFVSDVFLLCMATALLGVFD